MALLEAPLIGVAQRQDAAHVHLVEGGQHGGAVLRLLQPLGDALAQARHMHPLLPLMGRAGRCGRSRDRRRRCRRLARLPRDLGQGRGIGLDQPTILAAALHAGDVDAGFGDDLAYGGRLELGRDRCRCGGSSGHSRARGGRGRRGLAGSRGRNRGRSRGRGGSCADRGGGDPIGAIGDHAQHGADFDRGAGGRADFAEAPAGAGIDLQRHLVRLELEQRLVALDGVAHGLGPFGDGRLGHGFTEGGDDDIGCHGALLGS